MNFYNNLSTAISFIPLYFSPFTYVDVRDTRAALYALALSVFVPLCVACSASIWTIFPVLESMGAPYATPLTSLWVCLVANALWWHVGRCVSEYYRLPRAPVPLGDIHVHPAAYRKVVAAFVRLEAMRMVRESNGDATLLKAMVTDWLTANPEYATPMAGLGEFVMQEDDNRRKLRRCKFPAMRAMSGEAPLPDAFDGKLKFTPSIRAQIARTRPVQALKDMLDSIHEHTRHHPGLSLIDAVLTLAFQMYSADGSYLGMAVALKVFLKDLKTCGPEYIRQLETMDVFASCEHALLGDAASPDIAGEMRSVNLELTLPIMKRYGVELEFLLDGKPTDWQNFEEVARRAAEAYGIHLGDREPKHIAMALIRMNRLGYYRPTSSAIEAIEKAVAGHGIEFVPMAGADAPRALVEMIFDNAIITTIIGLFAVEVTGAVSPRLCKMVKELYAGRRDWSDVIELVRDLCTNAAAYVRYALTGDASALQKDMPPLQACIVDYQALHNEIEEMITPIPELRKRQASLVARVRTESALAARTKSVDETGWNRLLTQVTTQTHLLNRLPDSWRKIIPYFVIFIGKPGVGKTFFIKDYASEWVAAFKNKTNPGDGSYERFYSKSDPKFDAGYTPQTEVIFIDDFFGHTTPQVGNTVMRDLLTLLGPEVTFASSAVAEDKGTVPMLPSVVVMSENSLRHISRWSDNYTALFRRMQLRVMVTYRPGIEAGAPIDYERDTLYSIEQYVIPRGGAAPIEADVDGESATPAGYKVLGRGNRAWAREFIRNHAHAAGYAARRELSDHTIPADTCLTCRNPRCKLKPDAAYEDHPFMGEPMPARSGVVEWLFGFHVYELVAAVFNGILMVVLLGADFGFDQSYIAGYSSSIGLAATCIGVTLQLCLKPVGTLIRVVGDRLDSDRVYNAGASMEWGAAWLAFGWYRVMHVLTGGRMDPFGTQSLLRRIQYVSDAAARIDDFINSGRFKALKQIAAAIFAFAAVYLGYRAVKSYATSKDQAEDEPAKSVDGLPQVMSARATQTNPIANNVVRRYVRQNGKAGMSVGCVLVGPNITLTVHHFFPRAATVPIVRFGFGARHQLDQRPLPILGRNIQRVADDMALVYDRYSHLYDPRVRMGTRPHSGPAILLRQDRNATDVTPIDVIATYLPVSPTVWRTEEAEYGLVETPVFVIDYPAHDTMCGSPLVIPNDLGGYDVIGVLCAGHDDDHRSLCIAVTDVAMAAYTRLRAEVVDRPSVPVLQAYCSGQGVEIVDAPLHKDSVLRWAHSDVLPYVGRTVPERSSTDKCSMVPTMFTTLVEQVMGLPNTHVKPVAHVRPTDTEYGRGICTQMVEVANEGREPTELGKRYLTMAADHFVELTLEGITSRIDPLTMRQAINGTLDIRGINRRTGVGGLNRGGPKRDVLVPAPCPHYPNGVDLPEEHRELARQVYAAWLTGRHVPVIATTMGKGNEVRPSGKVMMRRITQVEYEKCIPARAVFEPMHHVMRKAPNLGFYVGKNVFGPDWRESWRRFQAINKDLGIDMDFAAFDMYHQSWMKDLQARTWSKIAQRLFNDPDVYVRYVSQCAADNTTTYYVFKGEVFVGIMTLSSGIVGTTEIQTFFSFVICRAGLAGAYPDVPSELFFPATGPSTLVYTEHGGDDGRGAVVPALEPFRGAEFQRFIQDEIGYKITSDADKTKPPTARPWSEITFYKRTFRPVGERVFAPLLEKSIAKQLHWRDGKSELDPKKAHELLLQTALDEWFMYGEAVYNARALQVLTVARACALDVTVRPYAEQLERFDRRELTSWAYEFEDMHNTVRGVCDCNFPDFWAMSGTTTAPPIGIEATAAATDGGEVACNVTKEDQVPDVCALVNTAPRTAVTGCIPADPWLERTAFTNSYSWTVGCALALNPVSIILANTPIANRLSYVFQAKSDIEVTVTMSVPPTYFGYLLVALGPYIAAPSLNQLVSLDAVGLIDASVCNRVCLRAPVFAFNPTWGINDATQATGYGAMSLYIFELTPLTASDSSPTDVPELTIGCRFVNMERFCPTPFNAVAGACPLPPVFRAMSGLVNQAYAKATQLKGEYDKTEGNRPSDTLDRVIKAAEPMTSWPIIGAGVRLVTEATGWVSGALRWLGFSAPAMLPATSWMYPRALPFLTTGYAKTPAVVFATDPEAAQNPSRVDVEGVTGDAFAFSNIYRRWGLAGYITWTSATSSGLYLANIPVTPALSNTGKAPTPVGLSAMTFNQWSGDLEFRLLVSASKFLRGRIGVFWTPNQTAPGSVSSLNLLAASDVMYFDVSGSADVTLTVPWGQTQPWISNTANMTGTQSTTLPSLTATNGWPYNGYLNIVVVENLAANTATVPTVKIVVLLRAGENFRVSMPTVIVGRNWYAAAGEAPWPIFVAMSAGAPTGTGVFGGGSTTVASHKFCGMVYPDKTTVASGGGEIYSSYRPLLHRLVPTMWANPVTAATSGGTAAQSFWLNTFRPAAWPQVTGTGVEDDERMLVTHLTILLACFAGDRGIVRHMVWPVGASSSNVKWEDTAFLALERAIPGLSGTTSVGNVGAYYFSAGNANLSTWVNQQGDTNYELSIGQGAGVPPGPATIDVPYVGPNWVHIRTKFNATTADARATIYGWLGSSSALQVIDFIGAGDDFQCYGWTGVPELTSQVGWNMAQTGPW